MDISVAGTGYVGLVTGVCLASRGHKVTCVETDRQKLAALRAGEPPIFEPGLRALMAESAANLTFTDDYAGAYKNAEVIFISVGTPERGDGYANLKYVYDAAEQIAASAESGCTVVMKSTVPMGTCEKLEKFFACHAGENVRIDVASNPEFLSQGTAVRDFLNEQRLVFGVRSASAEKVLRAVYAGFTKPVIVTDPQTAEMIKYASNNFLALKISFINEIANICELVGADVDTVSYGMGLDKRIGEKFLRAGIGYGGSCFPKDTLALHWLAKYHDYELKTVKAAIEVNENQRIRLIKKLRKYHKSVEGLRVAVLGLTFKPGTDDLREAPSVMNINILLEEGAAVTVWDPVAVPRVKAMFGDQVGYADTIERAVEGTDACLVLTEWEEIKNFDLKKFKHLMKTPLILDGRNCFDLRAAAEAGITYDSIGRKRVTPAPDGSCA
ncbi:UDPglucose 6-dehydrogenase [Sporobacter termitidis DSM 10068]|uniref:UDP-glucose 6-dehydrogenase n=1 Tax=Sporobacter termitidis DSM 10068 TaxID=1123282 RepID=A0A1M5Z8E2_9FIRM|nr:UDP-glucose/GDP-mannose dehydrogenase family protein [Sporobacter termitidis]SHI20163.1 UDPglucose 6-dehydrogenase [Sporobacter termitidis DSM 10068]